MRTSTPTARRDKCVHVSIGVGVYGNCMPHVEGREKEKNEKRETI